MSFAIDLPDDDPTIDALPPDARAVVARVWTGRTRSEQRAAVIFTAVARDLLHDGAVPEVLSLATRAVHDETRHVEVCRRVAARYAGAPVPWPAPEPPPTPSFKDAPPALARLLHVVLNTCVAESCGVAYLTACLDAATSPLARAAVLHLMRDDIGHARVGWAHLASDRVPAELRAGLPATLPSLMQAVRRAYFDRCDELPTDPPPGHGCATPAAIRAAIDGALREVVVPGFAHVGVDTAAARRWLAGIEPHAG